MLNFAVISVSFTQHPQSHCWCPDVLSPAGYTRHHLSIALESSPRVMFDATGGSQAAKSWIIHGAQHSPLWHRDILQGCPNCSNFWLLVLLCSAVPRPCWCRGSRCSQPWREARREELGFHPGHREEQMGKLNPKQLCCLAASGWAAAPAEL